MSVRVNPHGNNPITDNYSVRDNINQICSEPPKDFATTGAPTGMALLRQITQYQQERAQTYERFLNDYPIMSDILSAAMPPERQVCKADQEDNLHYLDSALAYARAQQVPVEEESSFFGTLGEIALAVIAIPFSIAGCSSEEGEPPVNKISNGNFCDYDDECKSGNCAKVGNEYFCKPWGYDSSDNYDAGSGSADAGSYVPEEECVSHDHKGCFNEVSVYWYDSCGNSEVIYDTCTDGICQNANCVPCPDGKVKKVYCQDEDQDHFGDPKTKFWACEPPGEKVVFTLFNEPWMYYNNQSDKYFTDGDAEGCSDCNDKNADINPFAVNYLETCESIIDYNCNTMIHEGCCYDPECN